MSTLPEIEKDRAMVCEIALDELRGLDDRYGILNDRQRVALTVLLVTNPFNGFGEDIGPLDFDEIDARHARMRRVRSKLTEAFPVQAEDAAE